jgi:hypothetical protein
MKRTWTPTPPRTLLLTWVNPHLVYLIVRNGVRGGRDRDCEPELALVLTSVPVARIGTMV